MLCCPKPTLDQLNQLDQVPALAHSVPHLLSCLVSRCGALFTSPFSVLLNTPCIPLRRLLTANVRINQQGGAANSPAQAPPQHLQQPQRQPSASSQPPSPPGVSQAPPLAPAPQPQPPLQQALTPTQPQPQQHQQPPLQQNGRPVDTSVGTFSSLVRRLGDEEPDTQVSAAQKTPVLPFRKPCNT